MRIITKLLKIVLYFIIRLRIKRKIVTRFCFQALKMILNSQVIEGNKLDSTTKKC